MLRVWSLQEHVEVIFQHQSASINLLLNASSSFRKVPTDAASALLSLVGCKSILNGVCQAAAVGKQALRRGWLGDWLFLLPEIEGLIGLMPCGDCGSSCKVVTFITIIAVVATTVQRFLLLRSLVLLSLLPLQFILVQA